MCLVVWLYVPSTSVCAYSSMAVCACMHIWQQICAVKAECRWQVAALIAAPSQKEYLAALMAPLFCAAAAFLVVGPDDCTGQQVTPQSHLRQQAQLPEAATDAEAGAQQLLLSLDDVDSLTGPATAAGRGAEPAPRPSDGTQQQQQWQHDSVAAGAEALHQLPAVTGMTDSAVVLPALAADQNSAKTRTPIGADTAAVQQDTSAWTTGNLYGSTASSSSEAETLPGAVASTIRPPQPRPVPRPQNIGQDDLLRLLAEAFSAMMLRSIGQEGDDGACQGRLSDAEVEVWLRQLLTLSRGEQGSSTVLELHAALVAQHSWLKLGDVYSALVALRARYGL
jgi:hypothetical protein